MPSSDAAVNWQPISQMLLIASMIDGALSDTHNHLQTLTTAQGRLHVLDYATVDRSVRVHTDQLEFVDIYDRQLQRWQGERPSATQKRELDRLEKQNRRLREVTMNVLATAKELRQDTIASWQRATWNSGWQPNAPLAARKPTLNIACNTLPCAFTRMGLLAQYNRPIVTISLSSPPSLDSPFPTGQLYCKS
jgi:hypothetical protein